MSEINYNQEEKTTDSIYELSCYNSNGIINLPQLRKYASLIFFTIFGALFLALYAINYLGYNSKLSIEYYKEFFNFNYIVISNLLLENEIPPVEYLQKISISFILAIIPSIYVTIQQPVPTAT